jgi:O-antigen/teichoic acid export membrane protein
MSLKQQAVSSVFWTALSTFSTQGISFFVSIILARLLLPSEFGLIAMMAVFMGIGGVLINSGISMSLIRTPDADDEDLSTLFLFNLLMSCLVYLIVFFSSYAIAQFYNQPLLENLIKVYSLTFIIDAFSTVQSTRLTKSLDFKTQMRVSVPSLIGSSIVGISMAYLGFGVWSLVYAALTKSTLASIQLWFYTKWRPRLKFNVTKFKYHWNFGYKLMFSALINSIFSNLYAILIGKYFVASQVGFFQRADTLKMLPVTTIGSILNKVTFPLFSKVQDDNIKLKEIYSKLMKIVIFIIAPLLLTMSALGEPLFRFLFTEKWLPAVPYFRILCFSGILYPIHAYNLNILNVKGRSDLFLKLEVIKKTILVVIIFISFRFGIYGLLIGSVFSSILAFFINTHYSGKFINYPGLQQMKDILPLIFLSTIIASMVFLVDFFYLTDAHDVVRLFIGSSLSLTTLFLVSHFYKLEPYLELRGLLKR